jgi:hypothetical protein
MNPLAITKTIERLIDDDGADSDTSYLDGPIHDYQGFIEG